MSEQFHEENSYDRPQPEYTPQSSKKERRFSAGKIIALALCFSIIGGILGAGGTFITMRVAEKLFSKLSTNASIIQEGNRPNAEIDITKIDTSKLMTPTEVYAANVNSTVGITTEVTTNYWGFQTTSAASGSGFVLTEDGYILTNHHVIENSNSIKVSTYNGKSYDAELVGYDVSNDIAVLKIDAKELEPVVIGNSDNLNVGDTVIAIGNPLGALGGSVSRGIISGVERTIKVEGVPMNLLQIDAGKPGIYKLLYYREIIFFHFSLSLLPFPEKADDIRMIPVFQ